jgi:hypothetical protein
MTRGAWTEADDRRLRELWGKRPMRQLVELFGINRSNVLRHAKLLGLPTGKRYFTPAEDEQLRALWADRPAAEIAAAIGRPILSIYQRAWRLRLPRKAAPRLTRRDYAAVKQLHKQGLHDAQIARRLGGRLGDHRTICWIRHRLGLPKNEEAIHAAQLRAVAAQQRTLGIKSPAELRSRAYARFAVERGWPEGMRPREVQILEFMAVAGGPVDRWTIAKGIGFNMKRAEGKHGQRVLLSSPCTRKLTSDGVPDSGSYLGNLMYRGLVVRLGRFKYGPGKGQRRFLYALSPAALDVITQRSQACGKTTA